MMWRLPEPRFDVASALDRGGRDYQEDSLVSDFAVGDDCGIVVLADGMGGHSAGDLASKTVVTEVYSELKFHSDLFFDHADSLPKLMLTAINNANGQYNKEVPRARGEADRMISAADGYAQKRINEAEGNVAAFRALLKEYTAAPEITRKRLYLETMAEILPKIGKTTIVDESAAEGILPMLNLNK